MEPFGKFNAHMKNRLLHRAVRRLGDPRSDGDSVIYDACFVRCVYATITGSSEEVIAGCALTVTLLKMFRHDVTGLVHHERPRVWDPVMPLCDFKSVEGLMFRDMLVLESEAPNEFAALIRQQVERDTVCLTESRKCLDGVVADRIECDLCVTKGAMCLLQLDQLRATPRSPDCATKEMYDGTPVSSGSVQIDDIAVLIPQAHIRKLATHGGPNFIEIDLWKMVVHHLPSLSE